MNRLRMIPSKSGAIIRTTIYLCFTLLVGILTACSGKKDRDDPVDSTDSVVQQADSETIEQLNQLIREDPKDATLFARRARLQFSLNNKEDAINDIAIALSLDSTVADYFIQQAEYYLYNGQPKDAKSSMTAGLNRFPSSTDLKLTMAEIHFILKEYAQAKILLREVLAIDDDIGQTYFLNGLISIENGDTANGIRFMQTAIDKEPDFYDAYMQAGQLYAGQDNDLAISYFLSAADLIPDSYEAHYQLALYYQEHGYFEQAIAEYDLIIDRIDSTIIHPYYNKGYIEMIYGGDFAEAIRWFTKVIELDPEYTDAWYNRGFCHELAKQYKQAREDYEQTLVLVPNYPLAIKGLNRLDEGTPIKVE